MKNVLVPVDFSEVTDRVIAIAEQLARAFDTKVWLFHCVKDHRVYAPLEQVPLVLPEQNSELSVQFPEQHGQLTAMTSSLKEKGINVEMLLVVGLPSDEILYVADRYQIDLIIMGSHGHGALYDLVVGSVAKAVLQQTSRLTLIVPSEVHKEVKNSTANQWEEPMATPY